LVWIAFCTVSKVVNVMHLCYSYFMFYCYVRRMKKLSDWMDEVELTIQDLKEESSSTVDYRQALDRFQVANNCFLLLMR